MRKRFIVVQVQAGVIEVVLLQRVCQILKFLLDVWIWSTTKKYDLATSFERSVYGVLDEMDTFLVRQSGDDTDQRYIALVRNVAA